jgi:hypothetical protein
MNAIPKNLRRQRRGPDADLALLALREDSTLLGMNPLLRTLKVIG